MTTILPEWRLEQFGPDRFRLVAPEGRRYTMNLFRKQAELLCRPPCDARVSVCPSPVTGLSGNTGKFMAGGVTCQGECGAITR
jgi:hypothetical protein